MKNQSRLDSLDLSAIAHQAMLDAGFVPDLPHSVLDELQALESKPPTAVEDSPSKGLEGLSTRPRKQLCDYSNKALDEKSRVPINLTPGFLPVY